MQGARPALRIAALALLGFTPPAFAEQDSTPRAGEQPEHLIQLAARQSCKSVSSCREAVIMWCNGYRRADGDNDGIPCENVCGSREEVDAIRREIGC